MPKTFSHSGDIGDLIYALPTIEGLGGGDVYMYPYYGTSITPETVQSAATLVEAQPYIGSMVFQDYRERAIVNLDVWRQNYRASLSLANMCLLAHHQPAYLSERPWLTVPELNRVARVVIHRSPRYHNEKFPWYRVIEKYRGELVMVGLKHEYEAFCRDFVDVPYYHTPNYLELAKVIAGSTLFIGNQRSPYAVAEGMKVNTIQEVCLSIPNCIFDRANAGYGIDHTVFLPDLP
jgi:hypothetical protein